MARKRIRAMYITMARMLLAVSLSGLTYLKPKKIIAALTTPMRAPPAMKPDAKRVPRSLRALLTFSSLLRLPTNQLMMAPTSSGALSYRGMNIPSEKGRAGTFNQLSSRARIAPTP